MTNKPQTIFKYSDPQPHLQTMAIKEHIVPLPKIVRFKYCQHQYQPISHPQFDQYLKIHSKIRPSTPQPPYQKVVSERVIQEPAQNSLAKSDVSKSSKKISVISRSKHQSSCHRDSIIVEEAPEIKTSFIHKIMKTDSAIFSPKESDKQERASLSHINIQPINKSFGCNFLGCQEPDQKQVVDYQPCLLDDKSNSKSNSLQSYRSKTVQSQGNFEEKSPIITILAQEKKEHTSESFKKQKSFREPEEKNMVRSSEETLDDIDIPPMVAQNWKKINSSQEKTKEIVVQIAPFVLPSA